MKIQLNAEWKLNDLITLSGLMIAQVRFDPGLFSHWIYRIGLNEQWHILQGMNQSEMAARTHVELLLERGDDLFLRNMPQVQASH